ncbi:LacI family DNA-binding transcriptional regulator [Murinocardiopsis flavida]|uniref:LacI family DNA-binding transcriptional regulator n=1 Tax=Murinocardiopsis flavida TaxID=645275 RepID=UPI0011B26C33|nr:LacI family DNA-binding transcriptional regulator [Murinocardiopsis flavida]
MPRIGDGRVVIGDVAAAAGVSVTTVSHVLSGKRPVGAPTRARVENAIEMLGYQPNPSARSMRTQRTESVAIVIPDITNPFFPLLAAGVQDVLHPEGYLISISDADLPSRSLDDVLRQVLNRRPDGILMASYGSTGHELNRIIASNTHLVRLSGAPEDELGDIVSSDDTAGVAGVVGHLAERGYRRIAFINGEQSTAPARLRAEGYRRGLREAGRRFDPALVRAESFTRAGGVAGARRLLELRPDALVCGNDLIAVGAMDVIRGAGLTVPHDIAVTGYDDIEAAALLSPALTTVHNPAREIGRACARMLLDRITGVHTGPAREEVLSTRLTVRDSS